MIAPREYFPRLGSVSPSLQDLALAGTLKGEVAFRDSEGESALSDISISLVGLRLSHPDVHEGPLSVNGAIDLQGDKLALRNLRVTTKHTNALIDGEIDSLPDLKGIRLTLATAKCDGYKAHRLLNSVGKLPEFRKLAPKNTSEPPAKSRRPETHEKGISLPPLLHKLRRLAVDRDIQLTIDAKRVDLTGFGSTLNTFGFHGSLSGESLVVDRTYAKMGDAWLWLRGQLDWSNERLPFNATFAIANAMLGDFARDLSRLLENMESNGLDKRLGFALRHREVAQSQPGAKAEKDMPARLRATLLGEVGSHVELRSLSVSVADSDISARGRLDITGGGRAEVRTDVFCQHLDVDRLVHAVRSFDERLTVAPDLSGLRSLTAKDLLKTLKNTRVEARLRADKLTRASRGLVNSSAAIDLRLADNNARVERLDIGLPSGAFRVSGSCVLTPDLPRDLKLTVLSTGMDLESAPRDLRVFCKALELDRLLGPADHASLKKTGLAFSLRLHDASLGSMLKDAQCCLDIDYTSQDTSLKTELRMDLGHSRISASVNMAAMPDGKIPLSVEIIAPLVDAPNLDKALRAIAGHLRSRAAAGPGSPSAPDLSGTLAALGWNTSLPKERMPSTQELLTALNSKIYLFVGKILNASYWEKPAGLIEDVRIDATNNGPVFSLARWRARAFRGQVTLDHSVLDLTPDDPGILIRAELQGLRPNSLLRALVRELFAQMDFEGELNLTGTLTKSLKTATSIAEWFEISKKTRTLGELRWSATAGGIRGKAAPQYVARLFPMFADQNYQFTKVVGIMKRENLETRNMLLLKALDGLDLVISGTTIDKLVNDAARNGILTDMQYSLSVNLRNTIPASPERAAPPDFGMVPVFYYHGQRIYSDPRRESVSETTMDTIQWRPERQLLGLLRDNFLLPAGNFLRTAYIRLRLADLVALPGNFVVKAFSSKEVDHK